MAFTARQEQVVVSLLNDGYTPFEDQGIVPRRAEHSLVNTFKTPNVFQF